jgi:hypothetical protein
MPPVIPCGGLSRDCPASSAFRSSLRRGFVAGGPAGPVWTASAGYQTFPPAPPNGVVRPFSATQPSRRERPFPPHSGHWPAPRIGSDG